MSASISRDLASAESFGYYEGRVVASYDWTSTTWADIHTALTISNRGSRYISRSNSAFTFARGGRYRFLVVAIMSATGPAQRLGFRARIDGSTAALSIHTYADVDTKNPACSYTMDVDVTENQTVTLQYCVSADVTGSVSGTTLNGETMPTATLHIQRIA